METIVFGPDLALGIPVMDQSHRIIYRLLETIHDLERPAYDDACRRLAIELEEDLAEEYLLMQNINYSGIVAHQAAHNDLLKAIDKALSLLSRNDETEAREIIDSLPNWVEAHINTMDLALAVEVTRCHCKAR